MTIDERRTALMAEHDTLLQQVREGSERVVFLRGAIAALNDLLAESAAPKAADAPSTVVE